MDLFLLDVPHLKVNLRTRNEYTCLIYRLGVHTSLLTTYKHWYVLFVYSAGRAKDAFDRLQVQDLTSGIYIHLCGMTPSHMTRLIHMCDLTH